MATIVYGDFEWDDAKAEANVDKHGVSIEEAATALVDPNAIFLADDSAGEERLVAIGMSQRTRVLFVVHVVASANEEVFYEQGS